MNAMTSVDEWKERMRLILGAAARAKANVDKLERKARRTRAVLAVRFRDAGKSISEAQERALADPLYEQAEAELAIAMDEHADAETAAEVEKMSFERWRSSNATKRAEMQLR